MSATQHEDAPLDVLEETETPVEDVNKSNKRSSSSPSGSKRPSKKAARLAEEVKRQQEEATATQAKIEARQHEIDLARAKRPDAEILVKDCTINLICNDSDSESFKSAVMKAAVAMKS